MKNFANTSKHHVKSLGTRRLRYPTRCEHHYTIIAHVQRVALMRCEKCGGLEAK